MTILHYGVWVAQPTRFTAQTERQDSKSPHITLYFTDDSSSRRQLSAAINVKSTDKDTRLVFWFDRNFSHPIVQNLQDLEDGFQLIRPGSHHPIPGLDFVRTQGLVDIKSGRILPHDIPGPDNDILDELEPILTDAIQQKATVYIFGSSYGSGIHDIHMNQGSLPRFENGVYEDGALLFQFDEGHWEAVFLAFASQSIPTDNKTGAAEEDGESLADIIGQ